MFGGFEDLASTAVEDEEEEDELTNIPKEKKTKQGYLKDGFVVDSDDAEEINSETSTQDDEFLTDDNSEEQINGCDVIIDDLVSELSEEPYDYDSDTDNKK